MGERQEPGVPLTPFFGMSGECLCRGAESFSAAMLLSHTYGAYISTSENKQKPQVPPLRFAPVGMTTLIQQINDSGD